MTADNLNGHWPIQKIRDLSDHVTVGFVGSMAHLFTDEGVPLLRGQNIEPYRINFTNLKYISEETHRKWKKSSLLPGDVVLVRVGYPGTAAVVPKFVGPLNAASLVIVRPRSTHLDPKYLAYVLNSPWGIATIKGRLVGSAQQVLNTGTVADLQIPSPPVIIQRRIASILGAYDDLIEVNRRRIALLEEMARRLFEEWFVRFGFPGHEDQAMVDTPDGPLPCGWQRVRLDEIARVNANTIKPANAPDRIGYIDIASVTRGDIQSVEWQAFADAPGRARRRVRDGSIIWSMVRPNRRSYALVVKPEEDLIVSTGFAVLDPHGTSSSYLYHYVTTDQFVGYLTGSATGAAYPAVTGATFERALVLLPPEHLDQKFNAVAEPVLRAVDTLRRQKTRLASSRDLLLPRLTSGELHVPSAEGELEAVA